MYGMNNNFIVIACVDLIIPWDNSYVFNLQNLLTHNFEIGFVEWSLNPPAVKSGSNVRD